MGADGGSIIKRSELVPEEKPEPESKIVNEGSDVWTKCALTNERLSDPVVSDADGSIYNKIAVLRYLLGEMPGKTPPGSLIKHIRDLVELNRDLDNGVWVDPITRKNIEKEGQSEAFGYIAECGHVSTRHILSESNCCPVCASSFEDFIILNPLSSEAKNHNENRRLKLSEAGLSHSLRPLKRTKPNLKRKHGKDSTDNKSRRIH